MTNFEKIKNMSMEEMAGSGVRAAKEATNDVKVKAEELRRCQGYLSLL